MANNIQPNVNSFSFELPELPIGDHYFVAFVAVDNINNVYANSTAFSIIAALPTSTTSTISSTATAKPTTGTGYVLL